MDLIGLPKLKKDIYKIINESVELNKAPLSCDRHTFKYVIRGKDKASGKIVELITKKITDSVISGEMQLSKLPININFNGKTYILMETANGGLLLNKKV